MRREPRRVSEESSVARGRPLQVVLGKLFGIKLEQQNFFPLLIELASKIRQTHLPTLCLGLSFLGVLIAARHWIPRLPGALLIVVIALGISVALGIEEYGVKVIGHVPSGLPLPRFPPVAQRVSSYDD